MNVIKPFINKNNGKNWKKIERKWKGNQKDNLRKNK